LAPTAAVGSTAVVIFERGIDNVANLSAIEIVGRNGQRNNGPQRYDPENVKRYEGFQEVNLVELVGIAAHPHVDTT